jgi:hypothetical protein
MVRAQILALTVLAVSLGCLPPPVPATRPSAPLAVERIFVEQLGRTAEGASARAQLIERIAERGQFVVVHSRDSADAVLRGYIGVRTERYVWPNPVRGVGELVLEHPRSGRSLWRAEYDRWTPTDPALESVPSVALTRAVVFFDTALHRAAERSAVLVTRQPNDSW